MEISSILLILAVFVMVGTYLYLPFMARARRARVNEISRSLCAQSGT